MIGIIIMILAIIPPALLLYLVWKQDKIEHEPVGFLVKLFFLGALTTLSALALETAFSAVLKMILAETSIPYIVIDNFFVVALVEEGGKFAIFMLAAWKSKEFDYVFDAVVYAVVISLGFATFENFLFLLDGSLVTAISRAIFSLPGHTLYAVYMGYFLGEAKYCDVNGDHEKCKKMRILALLVPVLIHGFYDFYLSMDNSIFIFIFLIFDIVVGVCTVLEFRKMASRDRQIYGFQAMGEQNDINGQNYGFQAMKGQNDINGQNYGFQAMEGQNGPGNLPNNNINGQNMN